MTTALLRRAASRAASQLDYYRAARLLDAALSRYPGGKAKPGTLAYRDQLNIERTATTCRMWNGSVTP